LVLTSVLLQKGKEVAHSPVHAADDSFHRSAPQHSNGSPVDPSTDHQEHGQAPNHSATSSTLPLQQPMTSAESDKDKEKDADKDKGSLSTTVTGTRSHTRSSHRKGNKLSDEGAHEVSPTKEKLPKSPNSKGQKPSFLTKLVRVLIPCVGHSTRAHGHEVNDVASDLALREKDAQLNGQPSANGRTTTDQIHKIGEPSTSTTIVSPAKSITIPPQISSIDTEIVVPPTPTKSLLPHAETEGVTSGAVQPPGSRGEELVHNRTHSRDSADESDATSTFTEDDDIDDINALDELEDEEDRLILNGGVGIPIGPVRSLRYNILLFLIFSLVRMVYRGPSCPLLPQTMLAANALFLISTKPCCIVVSR
jgi:carboxy-terminal domain RNA polymerase II polypeptide A small phosphatase